MREELYSWKYEHIAIAMAKKMKMRGFEAHVIDTNEKLISKLSEVIPEDSVVTTGGSVTLTETGIIDFLKSGKFQFLDRNAAANTEEKRMIELKAFDSEYYLCSANAITEDGRLVFLDGTGNRTAAVIYGPKNVIIVASINKIVRDIEDARDRLRYISPMNCRRLDLKTPCVETGECMDCSNRERICNYFVVVESSYRAPGRIKVLLTTFELGL
ncbi:MAG TPA: lactate utilization protein [Fervidobacterium sp.]|nr:lactate utilization protein [Fervidobacterium sp.]HOM73527.1 lactate utilization protein [Fervidobacterium sp.]HPP17415.1 lactate utilization protein [Fervidobacterium sp.]HPT54157.1 lactate utilization protein [Fervidobacterium sp.]HPZ17347.1 lactate utilization protein [Fervidobacterium sp.]